MTRGVGGELTGVVSSAAFAPKSCEPAMVVLPWVCPPWSRACPPPVPGGCVVVDCGSCGKIDAERVASAHFGHCRTGSQSHRIGRSGSATGYPLFPIIPPGDIHRLQPRGGL